ncbi:hypothetical protein [Neobacillus drentensis]|uniref:hypothetical protein n=1 Tax=Neobacillus drentensis TaxID=220684 RepID=UPI002FFF307C
MDKTAQWNRQNVYREVSDGQKHTREQVKCLSGGFRWTKRPKGTGKTSIGRGTDGQKHTREQEKRLSEGARWSLLPAPRFFRLLG